VVICLERGAGLHTAQLMALPLTVSCFSKIQIGFTVLPAHPGSPRQIAVKWVHVCVCVYIVCFPTYAFFFTFPYLSPPLLIFSFENRPASKTELDNVTCDVTYQHKSL